MLLICSKNINLLKKELYEKISEYYSEFLMKQSDIDSLLNIGLQYIKFGNDEKGLFKFLFQSDKFLNFNVEDLINDSNPTDIYEVIKKESNLNE